MPQLQHERLAAPSLWLFFCLSALMVGGCAGGGSIGDSRAGLACVDDTPACIASRQQTLSALVNSQDKSWINEPATPKAYASGVRLFAFSKRKTTLTCAELKAGRQEAANAGKVMGQAGAKDLTSAQISRGKMLATEVGRELRRETKKRC